MKRTGIDKMVGDLQKVVDDRPQYFAYRLLKLQEKTSGNEEESSQEDIEQQEQVRQEVRKLKRKAVSGTNKGLI